ncbi:MAG: Protein translocase subunit SecE [Candidatus Woesearchaeota archaeon]|nr:Protein translocase subunit SecE [Candidatus Woesearchaeota archaeon]
MDIVKKLKKGSKEYIRVLKVTKKPSMDEFKTIFKVTGLGIVIIGLVGFLLQIVRFLLK